MTAKLSEFRALLAAVAGHPEVSRGCVDVLADECERTGAGPGTVAALRDAAAGLEPRIAANAQRAWEKLPRLERLVQSKRQTAWKREYARSLRDAGARAAAGILARPAVS